jgi:hypothetical protein
MTMSHKIRPDPDIAFVAVSGDAVEVLQMILLIMCRDDAGIRQRFEAIWNEAYEGMEGNEDASLAGSSSGYEMMQRIRDAVLSGEDAIFERKG